MKETAISKPINTVHPKEQPGGRPFFFQVQRAPAFESESDTAIANEQSSPAFFTPAVQPKLDISHPDDPQEKEADAVAEQVMKMPEPVAVSEPAKEEEVDRQEEEEEEVQAKPEIIAPMLQRQEEEEEPIAAKRMPEMISRAGMKEGEARDDNGGSREESEINRKSIGLYHSDVIQRSGRGPPAGVMQFENNLQATKGMGSPMPDTTLDFMQSRFNTDFSGVRIHTGSYAEDMSRSIHAQAFTHGNDIYFNSGKFSPDSDGGRTLLAHELTHTIQQGAVRTGSSGTGIQESIQKKQVIQRVPEGPVPQLTNAVKKAKSKENKVNANKDGPDGYREGWRDLLDFFKTTFGADKIISGEGGTTVTGTVAEQDIKKKRTTTGMIVNKDDINGDRITGKRDAMPSWCGIFVFWALNKSGVPMPKWQLGKSFIKPEAAYKPGYVPRTGDIAYREGYSHYAIVESSTGNQVRTVNGNTAGEDNLGGQIQTHDHAIDHWSVFFNPLVLMEGTLGSGAEVAEKPKTLKELRRELFNVNRKEASVEQEEEKEREGERRGEEERIGVEEKGREEEEEQILPAMETNVHTKAEKVQGGWFDDAISFVDSAIDYVKDGLEAGKRMLLGEARDFVMAIPGYKALRVILGEDPITGEEIARNGRNFIEAAFDIIPGGRMLHEKLTELGALDEAALWIDNGIAAVETLVEGVLGRIERFWNNLSLESLANPTQIFRDAGDIIHSTISNVVKFAIDAGKELLEIVKKWLLTQVVDFIRERTTAYPLLTVILGQDPVTEARVDRNGTNILNAILELGGEEGVQQRAQMQDTGTFAKVAGWIDQGILVFGKLYQTIRDNFGLIWSLVSIETLMNPVEKFTEIYNTFAAPVTQVLQFVADTAKIILQFIKEVLMKRLSEWARGQRGYYLVTVILGKDPFTDEKVHRSTENVIHGFMSLMEGGEEQFQQMKESGAIERASKQIEAAVETLNMTPAYIVGLFINLWKSFGLSDLANPPGAFARIFQTLARPIRRLITFVATIVKIVVVVILEIMQFPFDLINNIIAKTAKSFELIKSDPIGFLKNILRAIKQGFIQFFDNILTHLLNGLVGWLTMELKDAGMPELKDLSLKGVISWVLEVLGISMEKIWEKLAKHPKIGPERVAKIRGMINTLTGIWTFIKDVQERGIVAIWDRIKEQLSNLWNTVLDAVKNWIMEKIITQVTVKLLSMLDPTGIMAVVNSCIAIYKAVQSFIKYLRQMLEILNSFVEGVAEIAGGNIMQAAGFLERTMARGIPIVIGFLANQVGLGGIGKRIGEMIEKVREMVDKALEWLVNKAVDVGGKLFEMGKSAAGAVMGWLGMKKVFTSQAGKSHQMYFKKQGEKGKLIIESDPVPVSTFLNKRKNDIPKDSSLDDATKSSLASKVNQAEQLVIKIEGLTYPKDKNAPPPESVELEILENSEKLVQLLKELDPAGSDLVIPAPQFIPGFTNGARAQFFEMKYVSDHPSPNYQKGEDASKYKGNLSGALTTLVSMGVRAKWVAFHIVNDNYGGKATDSNLVPAPQYINKDYRASFEDKLKSLLAQKHPVWMRFNSAYRGGTPFLESISAVGGGMKFENNNWEEDAALNVPQYSTPVDEPKAESIEVNSLVKDPVLWYFYEKETALEIKSLDFLAAEVGKGIRFTSKEDIKQHMEKVFIDSSTSKGRKTALLGQVDKTNFVFN